MEHVRRRPRGQAIAETVLFLPLALLTLFTVIWAAQYGVMSERVQSAIRYSGLVGNQINPYMEASMYAMYNGLGSYSLNAAIPSQTCNPPITDALNNNNVSAGSTTAPGSYPGPVNGTFWQATPAPPTVACSNTTSQRATFSSGLYQPALALSNTPQITTSTVVPPFLQGLLGATTPATASLNFMKPADMATILTCHPLFQQSIAASLAPTPPPASPTIPTALTEPLPTQTAVPESGC
jgi:hypothetical protein